MSLIFGLVIALAALAIACGVLWLVGAIPAIRLRGVWLLAEVGFQVVVSLFHLDRWAEVWDTIRRNKLRTALTAVSVAWGIFVMVALLGLGNGLNRGVRHSFRRESTNSVVVSANKTALPYAGYGIGRKITFHNSDYEAARANPAIEHVTGQFFVRGGRFGGNEMKVQRGAKSNAFPLNAVHADAYHFGNKDVVAGRFLSALDIAARRKVAVIGRPVREFFFGADDPIGQWIVIAGVAFQVVGMYSDADSEDEERQIYIPVSTAQLAFHGADRLNVLMFTVEGGAATSREVAGKVKASLAAAHQFSAADPQAIRVFDNAEGSAKITRLFMAISIFVVVIGLGTLAAGVVGVSNIMMIAVNERTKEIGIRKALGATPQSIIAMIVQEAVLLTSVAGLVGLAAAVGFLSALPHVVDTELIRDPSVQLRVGILAAIGLVVAGATAGFVPARAAARINPVHTLRDQ